MRCFIAVELSPEIIENITRVQKELPSEGLKLVEKENLHITVKFLGKIDEKTKEKIIGAMQACATRPFSLKSSSLGVFPSLQFMRVIWVGIESEELIQLQKCLDNELHKLGFAKDQFRP
ncbi:RNA 2',3'-cyclic phosphodiesterase, partial [Candidatus Micrarchaeota archaeon]|nr:RNA 2',3'-cyclic phosphodiesterase [Candidatus Micrarchaeota archaeon]